MLMAVTLDEVYYAFMFYFFVSGELLGIDLGMLSMGSSSSNMVPEINKISNSSKI